MKVCHFTSAHTQEDIRIFHKECVSLANAGYDIYQISCGTTYENKGVHLVGIGDAPSGRLERMTKTARKAYKIAKELNADVYHFHDPELMPYGLKLKRKGKKVIFDSHEDVPAQIMDKYWIPKPLRKMVSDVFRLYETHVVKKLDAVVVATSYIGEKFKGRAKEVVIVNNYPKLDDIVFHDTPFEDRDRIICYAGGIDENRGEKIMIEATTGVDVELIIAGDHIPMEIEEGIKYVGKLDRFGINELYGKAIAGLCILKPIDNYFHSKPIKIYEYMAAGLPYICSDFPGWRKVAEESGAGICVDPRDIEGIRNIIRNLINNPIKAQEMGKKGREYVVKNCTWSNEEKRLLLLYKKIGMQ